MKYFLKQFRGALISALIFVLLLGFIFFRDSDSSTTEVEQVDESYVFMPEGQTSSVEIYYPDSWIILEREGENWFLVRDEVKVDADNKQIAGLIEDMNKTEIIGTVPTDEVDLDQFGLENAKAEIVLITDQEDQRFIIGDSIPVGSGTYVYDPEEKLVLVVEKDYLDKYMDMSFIDFREKGLLSLDTTAVNRLSIWSGNFTVDLYKEDGEWYVEGQDELFVDNKKIDELLWIFSRAKVIAFEDENPQNLKRYGLDEPTTELRFYEDDQIQGIVFGKRKNEDTYYVQSDLDDTVYSIHKSLFKRVPKNLDDITLR